LSNRKKMRVKKIDENIPFKPRNVDEDVPKPIGIYGKDISHCVFVNNTFVDVPTPILIEDGYNNFFWNNRSFKTRTGK
jgi:hypothetical protein